jgi:hypothetical protein
VTDVDHSGGRGAVRRKEGVEFGQRGGNLAGLEAFHPEPDRSNSPRGPLAFVAGEPSAEFREDHGILPSGYVRPEWAFIP